MSIYNCKVKTMNNNEVSISDYKGKVLLIVNTATRCGFTKQYNDLQELYSSYKDKGFEILDFPCNQFAQQAPETNNAIHDFCTLNFGIKFEQFAKIDVNGKDEIELYTLLKKQKKGLLGSRIKWNFTKFLVDSHGNVVARYSPNCAIEKIELEIKNLLNK